MTTLSPMEQIGRITRLTRQIQSADAFISNSGRGDIGKEGRAFAVKTTGRGLTIKLDNGQRVVWRMTRSMAQAIVDTFAAIRVLA